VTKGSSSVLLHQSLFSFIWIIKKNQCSSSLLLYWLLWRLSFYGCICILDKLNLRSGVFFFFRRTGKKSPKKRCFGLTNVLESVLIWQPVYFCTVIYSRLGDFLYFAKNRSCFIISLYLVALFLGFITVVSCNELFSLFPCNTPLFVDVTGDYFFLEPSFWWPYYFGFDRS